jgi:hypothetical protein
VDGDGDVDVLVAGSQLTVYDNQQGTLVDVTAQLFAQRPSGFGIPRLVTAGGNAWLLWVRAAGVEVYQRSAGTYALRNDLGTGAIGNVGNANLVATGFSAGVELALGIVDAQYVPRTVVFAFDGVQPLRDVTAATLGANTGFFAVRGAGDVDGDGDADAIGEANPGDYRLLRGAALSLRAPFAALIGQTFEVRVGDASASPTQPVIATVLLGQQARVPLGGLGILRIDPASAIFLPALRLNTTEVSLQLAVPNLTALRDRVFAVQAVHVDRSGQLRLGPALRERFR